MYLINTIYIILMNIIFILISVAFLTLLERKILSYIQIRKGPNKISMMGLIQPFSDAIKLFIKENFLIMKSNYLIYLISPMISMILMMMIWMILPFFSNLYSMNLSIIFMISILSMGVYVLMLSGWSSNSLYSMIGSLRSIAQTISYEASMILIIMNLLIFVESFNLYLFMINQKKLNFLILFFPIFLMLLVSLLAELNRTPFDFSEGESELVSGFNIEYMSGSFAMIFISEYGMILFSSYLINMFFLKGDLMNFYFYLKFMIMVIFMIWIRGSYPRFRYDNLMYLTWKFYLPINLMFLIFYLILKLYLIL